MERAVEVILLILAATYAVSGKHTKDTSLAAYKAGKEPPGLVKARLRHEAGGGRFVTRPGKDKQQPKGLRSDQNRQNRNERRRRDRDDEQPAA